MASNSAIPYGRQNISEEDVRVVLDALQGEWLTTGPAVEKFESQLTALTGSGAVVLSSGTAALHCAYSALGLGPGDEVITPPLTFIATQATAALLGAKIVFADVQSDTGNIDPEDIESRITRNTKAITMVDYAGHPCEIDEIVFLAKKYGLAVVEDAAHSVGSTYKSRPIGGEADLSTFSFFPTKNLTTGEDGAVLSKNLELLDKARKFGRQGLVRTNSDFVLEAHGPWHQEVHNFGLNYRLPDILCALGSSQLNRIDKFKAERKRVFEKYCQYLSSIPQVKLPTKRSYVDPMWHLFPIRVPSHLRKNLFVQLRSYGYLVQVNYLPAHLHPVFSANFSRGDFPRAEKFYAEEISLPMYVDESVFTENYFEVLANRIEKFFTDSNRK